MEINKKERELHTNYEGLVVEGARDRVVSDTSKSVGSKAARAVGSGVLGVAGVAGVVGVAAVAALPLAVGLGVLASAAVLVEAGRSRVGPARVMSNKEEAIWRKDSEFRYELSSGQEKKLANRSVVERTLDSIRPATDRMALSFWLAPAGVGAALGGAVLVAMALNPVGLALEAIALAGIVGLQMPNMIFKHRLDKIRNAAEKRGIPASSVPIKWDRKISLTPHGHGSLADLDEKLQGTDSFRSGRWISAEQEAAALAAIARTSPVEVGKEVDVGGKLAQRHAAESVDGAAPVEPKPKTPT